MQLKTFRALNMRDALQAVKEELGPDAVILSTRQVQSDGGAFGLFSRPLVEVTAAVDRGGARPGVPGAGGWNGGARPSGKEPAWAGSGREGAMPPSAGGHAESGRFGGRGDGRVETAGGDNTREQYGGDVHEDRTAILSHGKLVRDWENLQKLRRQEPTPQGASFLEHMESADEAQGIQEDLAQIKKELRELRRLAGPTSGEREGWKACEQDLRGVRRLVGTLVTNERALFIQRLTGPLETAYYWLLDTGLDADVVFTLVKELEDCLPFSDDQLRAALGTSVHQLMARVVKTSGPLLDEENGPKAVMIVGPTGVGKTTTIAKLAALYALRQKRKVALITLDTYRVAAVEQLRVYGKILGLAVDVALTCEDLAGLLRMRRSADLILIDTAGRSPLDQAALRELKKLVGPNREVEVHLLLSAATREADLTVVLERFMTLPVKSVIFSKLDETTQFGSIFNVLHRTGLPLSYLSTGQRVPEDLEVGAPHLLAELLLNGLAAIKTSHSPVPIQLESAGPMRKAPSSLVPEIPVEPKGHLLGALGWALARRSGKKSGA